MKPRPNISVEFATIPGHPHYVTIYHQHPVTGSMEYERCYVWGWEQTEATKRRFEKHGWLFSHAHHHGSQLTFYREKRGKK